MEPTAVQPLLDSAAISAIVVAFLTTVSSIVTAIIASKKSSELKKAETKLDNVQKAASIEGLLNIKEAEEKLCAELGKPVDNIMIIGSRVSYCRDLIKNLAKQGKIDQRTKIHIIFRMGSGEERYDALRESGKDWQNLAGQYELDLRFHYVQSFEHSFQGLMFDEKIGIVGFYHTRMSTSISSGEFMLLHRDNPNPIHKYLIDNFLKCFEFKKAPYKDSYYKSINEAVEAHINGSAAGQPV